DTYLSVQAPLLRALTFSAADRALSANNSLWLQTGLAMNAEYLADVTKYASAGLQRVDYVGNHELARKTINQWVSGRTNNRIHNLLATDAVSASTRAILVNMIYWKANWASEFYPAATKTEPFHLLTGRDVPTPLMHQEGNFPVLDRDGAQAIEIPYAGGEVSMVVLMPDSPAELPRFEAKLTDRDLTRWLTDLGKAKPRRTMLTLPKMHLSWGANLVPTLQAMGVQAAFDRRADFSGAATISGDQILAIGAIIHQSWLDVDEKGSEAAAATAVIDVVITGARRKAPELPPVVFRADKPFVFLLRDRRTGMILFIGRYVMPTSGSTG
ncbi:MAG: serpin family protein, partial [Proteobacteria bacterium]|nr:serpin family protein [Pseudomonadota bacterium]